MTTASSRSNALTIVSPNPDRSPIMNAAPPLSGSPWWAGIATFPFLVWEHLKRHLILSNKLTFSGLSSQTSYRRFVKPRSAFADLKFTITKTRRQTTVKAATAPSEGSAAVTRDEATTSAA